VNAKTNFLKNRELAKYWVSIARDQRFAEVITHARAILCESRPDKPGIEGAESFVSILETMVDGPENDVPFPSPGLHHNADTLPPKQGEEPKPRKRKQA
jgi:hypothetical protein